MWPLKLSKIKNLGDFQPRWRRRWTHCASSHNQKKDNNKFKNKKQPELTENRTVWKSDNQGVKEETFIQTGRRGGDRQQGREDSWQGCGWVPARWRLAQWVVPHSVQINQEEQLGSETDQQPRVPAGGNKASNPLTEKTCGGRGSRRNSQPHRRVRWRDPQGPRTHKPTHPGISTRRAQFACG